MFINLKKLYLKKIIYKIYKNYKLINYYKKLKKNLILTL